MELKTLIKSQIMELNNKQEKDAAITARLINLNLLKGKVLFYNSLAYEVDTQALKDYYSDKVDMYLPRVNGDDLQIIKIDNSTQYIHGIWGIIEPSGETVNDKIDICITPLVAFDAKLNRKGKGKGYYDRYFANNDCLKIGLAYDLQQREFGVNIWDIPLDIVVTETRTIFRNSREK